MDEKEIKYFLVLEYLPGDYNIVDINHLDICNNLVANELESIDSFTCSFSENMIKESIIRSNIVPPKYIAGNLRILSSAGHNFRCLFKEDFDTIKEFQDNDEELYTDVRNKLFGKYKKIIEHSFADEDFSKKLLDIFKNAIKENNKKEIFSIIEELPYNKSRDLYLIVTDNKQIKSNKNLRKLAKLSDVA